MTEQNFDQCARCGKALGPGRHRCTEPSAGDTEATNG